MAFKDSSLFSFVNELADSARELTLKYFRKPYSHDVDNKTDQSPVTQVDIQVEDLLRSMIKEKYPSHGVIGEELGSENIDAEYVWTLDPIDGTISYINGVPLFTTLIGVIKQGQPFLGLIDQPFLKERWFGDRYKATFNNRNTIARPCGEINSAYLYTTAPEIFNEYEAQKFKKLSKSVKASRIGGADCYHYGMLSSGWIDIVCEKLSVYEYSAIAPVVVGAGGVVSDWGGGQIDGFDYKTIIAVGDSRLHKQVISLLD